MIYKKAKEILKKLADKGENLAIAESCTGGLMSSAITCHSGASQVFLGGLVAYSNSTKHKLLGINMSTLEEYGAVSSNCASEMAQGIFNIFASDYAVAITGIAGPTGGTDAKPVGLVYISVGNQDTIDVFEYHFYGDRETIQHQAVMMAFDLLEKKIDGIEVE